MKNKKNFISLEERIDDSMKYMGFFIAAPNSIKVYPSSDVVYGLFILFEDLAKKEAPNENKYRTLYSFLEREGFYNFKNMTNVNDAYNLLIKEKLVLKADRFINIVNPQSNKKFTHEEIFNDMSHKFNSEELFEKFFIEMAELWLLHTFDLDSLVKKNCKKVNEKIVELLSEEDYDFFTKRKNGFLPYELMNADVKKILREEFPHKYVNYEKENISKSLKPAESLKNKVKKRI